jgi:hypothetical protein
MPCVPPQFIIWAVATIVPSYTFVDYEAFLDGVSIYRGSELQAEICVEDDETHIVEVTTLARDPDGVLKQSFHSINTGTIAELAPPVDPQPTPTVSATPTATATATPSATPTATPTATPSALPLPVLCELTTTDRADLDRDGTVGFADFSLFSGSFGATNNAWEACKP